MSEYFNYSRKSTRPGVDRKMDSLVPNPHLGNHFIQEEAEIKRVINQATTSGSGLELIMRRSNPNFLRRLHDRIQLAPHLVFAEHFRVDAAEAALRAEGHLFRRQEFARLIDALFQIVDGFHIGVFGRD